MPKVKVKSKLLVGKTNDASDPRRYINIGEEIELTPEQIVRHRHALDVSDADIKKFASVKAGK